MTVTFTKDNLEGITDPKLAEKIISLLNLVEETMTTNNQLVKENQLLKAELNRIKKQSAPPTFSSLRYTSRKIESKNNVSEWKKSGKKDTLEIDQVVEIPTVQECKCGNTVFSVVRSDNKTVQGITIKRHNTSYILKEKKCKQCGEVYKPVIPETIKGIEFDNELRTWISYLKFKCRLTHPLIHDLLTDMGVKISTGQVSNILQQNSKKLSSAYTHLRIWGIKNAPYLQTDATGHKTAAPKTRETMYQYMHFLGNEYLSLFRITKKYNINVLLDLITRRGRAKVLVSDDGGPNASKIMVRNKQLCWIHEWRHYFELKPVIDMHKRQVAFVADQFYQLYLLGGQYRDGPTKELRVQFEEEFNRFSNQLTGYKELDFRIGLTKNKKKRLLLFLDHPEIPIHNNQSERDLRPAVIIRKISGTTKSAEGNRSIERHLSVIHTARKQGLSVLETLHGLLTNQVSPFVLTTRTHSV